MLMKRPMYGSILAFAIGRIRCECDYRWEGRIPSQTSVIKRNTVTGSKEVPVKIADEDLIN